MKAEANWGSPTVNQYHYGVKFCGSPRERPHSSAKSSTWQQILPLGVKVDCRFRPVVMNQTELLLQTDRLFLRPLSSDDDAALSVIAGAREIADTTISVPHPLTLAIARDWIRRENAAMRSGSAIVLVIRKRHAAELLGLIALRNVELEHACAELSFWLTAAVQHQGYATEAAEAIIQHGFGTLGLNRIDAYQMVRNSSSERVLTRLRFHPEGILRERVRKWGVFEDVRMWSLLHSD